MNIQRIAIILTVINLIIMTFLLAKMNPAKAQQQQQQIVAPVLRARGLEIVDSLGRLRASITIQPAVTVKGIFYPQTVLLRLIDTKGGPLVKLEAAENGAGLGLSDDADGGVHISAKSTGTFVKLTNKEGKQEILKP